MVTLQCAPSQQVLLSLSQVSESVVWLSGVQYCYVDWLEITEL